ncbi:MAG: alpha/beta hydrolase [Candidatus Dojkabacteria bacterium]
MEQKQIIIKNVLLNYYAVESTTESSKVLVFLHGWRSNSTVWFNLIKDLSQRGYNCIALDLPGFGRSQTPQVVYDTNKYADVVEEFLTKLHIEDAIFIGHSYGGRVLINLGVRNKLMAKKIILVDASGIGMNENGVNLMKVASKLVKPIFKIPALQGLRKKIYEKIGGEDYIAAEDSPYFKMTYQNIIKDQYNGQIRNITIPTYLIWGENDNDTPVEMAATMEELIPGSKLEFIMNAGHFPFVDNPIEFEKVLLDFLEE